MCLRETLATVVLLAVLAVSPRAQATQESHTSTAAAQSNTSSDQNPKKQQSGSPASPSAGINQTTAGQSGTNQPEPEEEIRRREESQRILGVVPMFGVTNRRHPPPLTPRQKFNLFLKARSIRLTGRRLEYRRESARPTTTFHNMDRELRDTQSAMEPLSRTVHRADSLLTSPTQCCSKRIRVISGREKERSNAGSDIPLHRNLSATGTVEGGP